MPELLNGVPCSIESGNTVIFTETFTEYPTADYAATLYLSLNGTAAANATATESGETYTFTLSAAATAALTPGLYDFAIYVAGAGSTRYRAKTGQLRVTPNLAVTRTPTTAEAMVAALNATILSLSSTTNASVSFNGQSYTKRDMPQLQSTLTWWMARVDRERRADAVARGEGDGSVMAPRFGNGGAFNYPFGKC